MEKFPPSGEECGGEKECGGEVCQDRGGRRASVKFKGTAEFSASGKKGEDFIERQMKEPSCGGRGPIEVPDLFGGTVKDEKRGCAEDNGHRDAVEDAVMTGEVFEKEFAGPADAEIDHEKQKEGLFRCVRRALLEKSGGDQQGNGFDEESSRPAGIAVQIGQKRGKCEDDGGKESADEGNESVYNREDGETAAERNAEKSMCSEGWHSISK